MGMCLTTALKTIQRCAGGSFAFRGFVACGNLVLGQKEEAATLGQANFLEKKVLRCATASSCLLCW